MSAKPHLAETRRARLCMRGAASQDLVDGGQKRSPADVHNAVALFAHLLVDVRTHFLEDRLLLSPEELLRVGQVEEVDLRGRKEIVMPRLQLDTLLVLSLAANATSRARRSVSRERTN